MQSLGFNSTLWISQGHSIYTLCSFRTHTLHTYWNRSRTLSRGAGVGAGRPLSRERASLRESRGTVVGEKTGNKQNRSAPGVRSNICAETAFIKGFPVSIVPRGAADGRACECSARAAEEPAMNGEKKKKKQIHFMKRKRPHRRHARREKQTRRVRCR